MMPIDFNKDGAIRVSDLALGEVFPERNPLKCLGNSLSDVKDTASLLAEVQRVMPDRAGHRDVVIVDEKGNSWFVRGVSDADVLNMESGGCGHPDVGFRPVIINHVIVEGGGPGHPSILPDILPRRGYVEQRRTLDGIENLIPPNGCNPYDYPRNIKVKDEYTGYIPITKTADDINVVVNPTPTNGKYNAVLQDNRRQRAWSGEGTTQSDAATDATRKFLNDRHAPEYVGKK